MYICMYVLCVPAESSPNLTCCHLFEQAPFVNSPIKLAHQITNCAPASIATARAPQLLSCCDVRCKIFFLFFFIAL